MRDILDDLAEMLFQGQREREQTHTHCCGFSLDAKQSQSGCGHRWSHKASDFDDQDSYDQGHHCPKCGRGPWRWKLNPETLAEFDNRRAHT